MLGSHSFAKIRVAALIFLLFAITNVTFLTILLQTKSADTWFWLIVYQFVGIMCVPSLIILLQANLQVGGVVLVGGMPVGRKGKEGSVTSKVTRFEICNKASHCFDGVIMSFTIHECYACNIKRALSSSYSGH